MTQLSLPELLQKLVSIPSINPALSDDDALAGEKRLADFLADFLKNLGFSVEIFEDIPSRPNIVGRIGPAKPKKSIILESHLDTQGIHGMSVDPFAGEIRDGRLYGRGACDTKGPMAAAMFALEKDILRDLTKAGVQLIYIGAYGEEKGNLGAEELVERGVGADEIIVLEPTELSIVHAHKGALWYEVDVTGKAVHGSSPELGINAITGMMKVVDRIRDRVEADRAKRKHALLGSPSVNFGIIRGGSSINIVPDRCVMEVDQRTLPGDNHEQILDRVRLDLEELKRQGVIQSGRIQLLKNGIPFETTSHSKLVQTLCDGCAKEGVAPKTEGAPWYSDAGPFSRTCREVAVFGPGSIRQAHTVDEYIELASLEKGCNILKHYLRQLAVAQEGA